MLCVTWRDNGALALAVAAAAAASIRVLLTFILPIQRNLCKPAHYLVTVFLSLFLSLFYLHDFYHFCLCVYPIPTLIHVLPQTTS
jgi:hypothetical protein